MEKLKVVHDQFGNHNPLAAGKGIKITDVYELKDVTLRFITFELNRESTHAVWSDTYTGKQYRSDVRLQEDAVNEKLLECRVSKVGGLFITGNFGFHQVGQHVLLTVLETPPPAPDAAKQLEYIKEILSRYLEGDLKGYQFKQEIKMFMKS
jgi:hypothetical protein